MKTNAEWMPPLYLMPFSYTHNAKKYDSVDREGSHTKSQTSGCGLVNQSSLERNIFLMT